MTELKNWYGVRSTAADILSEKVVAMHLSICFKKIPFFSALELDILDVIWLLVCVQTSPKGNRRRLHEGWLPLSTTVLPYSEWTFKDRSFLRQVA